MNHRYLWGFRKSTPPNRKNLCMAIMGAIMCASDGAHDANPQKRSNIMHKVVETRINRLALDCSGGDLAVVQVAGLGWAVLAWDGREAHDMGMTDTREQAFSLADEIGTLADDMCDDAEYGRD